MVCSGINRKKSELKVKVVSAPEVIVIGAGLAGLNCARELAAAGKSFLLLEKSDGVGGRVRTDEYEGFLLDRGFQVLLSAYPEARKVFTDPSLDFQRFYPGSLVYLENRFHRVADPYRRFMDALESFLNPVGTPMDKLKVRSMRQRALSGRLKDLFSREEMTALEYLERRGFSRSMMDRFFKPFLGGVFLENELQTSSRQLEFVFRMFALGDTVIPRYGMGKLAESLAAQLPEESVRLNSEVVAVRANHVELANRETLKPKTIVIATEGPTCARWLGESLDPGSRGTRCLYFASDQAPIEEPILALNGTGNGPVNHLCVISEISSSYAPSGLSLISVNVVDQQWQTLSDGELERSVRNQLVDWFGESEVRNWNHVRTYNISHAQPHQTGNHTPTFGPKPQPVQEGIYICGDHIGGSSINGALKSGRAVGATLADG